MSDKINIDLDKVEGSMSAIMGQMGLGVKIKGGGSNPADQGGGSQTASDKKNKKSSKDKRGSKDSKGSTGNLIDAKPGDKKNGKKDGKQIDKVTTSDPTKKKEDKVVVQRKP